MTSHFSLSTRNLSSIRESVTKEHNLKFDGSFDKEFAKNNLADEDGDGVPSQNHK